MKKGIVGKFGVILVSIFFGVVVTRNAWLHDDAYITFRTVDNFINGYGLTWNIQERVQTFTHPLWMLALSGLYALSGEIYFTSLFLSIAVSVAAVLILGFGVARSYASAFTGILLLTFSKAFVDYSTSGLENPLTHLILAVLYLVYFTAGSNPRKIFLMSIIVSLGLLNRMDTLPLLALPLIYEIFRLRRYRVLMNCLLGLSPFILWELFSLFYYGFPFSNTAYAKLNTGIPAMEKIRQGLEYLFDSIALDPLTLSAVFLAVVVTLRRKKPAEVWCAAGIVLYLVYVVRIGGCFMSGRFFSPPVFCVALLFSRHRYKSLVIPSGLGAAILAVGLTNPRTPVRVGADFQLPADYEETVVISDERLFFYPATGLFNGQGEKGVPAHQWARKGLEARSKNEAFLSAFNTGFLGYFAGPGTYIFDHYALADSLLARLPVIANTRWHPGHFNRLVPEGYMETLKSGLDCFKDRNLAIYYSKLSHIIRGELSDMSRLPAIWGMNTGAYNHLIDYEAYRYHMLPVENSDISKPSGPGVKWNHTIAGVHITLPGRKHSNSVELIADGDNVYKLSFYLGESEVGEITIPARRGAESGNYTNSLQISQDIAARGYDTLKFCPVRGNANYRLDYLRLI